MAGIDTPPLVSIVTASFNSASYIENAIRSVADQNYPNIEHIIVDGGSTDGTLEILKRNSGGLVWVSEPDRGQSDAINKGWQRANGQIFGWLDADNVYEPYAVAEAVEALTSADRPGMVYAGVRDVDESDIVVREYRPPEFSLLGYLLFHEFNFIPPSSVFIGRQALDRAGLLDVSLHYTMDFDLWLRMGLATTITRVDRFWSRFLLRDASKTGSQMERFGWDILKVIDKFFARGDIPAEIRNAESRIRARQYEHAADRIVTADFNEARRWYRRALMVAPLSASGALWRRVTYSYYRDSILGRTYRGMKTRLKPVI